MEDRVYELHGVRILECAPEGPQLRSDRDAVDLVGAAMSHNAAFLVIPTERLADDFFQLKTRVAGEIIHRFTGTRSASHSPARSPGTWMINTAS